MKHTHRRGTVRRRLAKGALLIVSLVLLPTLFLGRAHARRAPRIKPAADSARGKSAALLVARVERFLEQLKQQLEIPSRVVATLVQRNERLVSVERTSDGDNAFALVLEESFVSALTDDELRAVLAHELGHVWIFSHHPYLHTEELANEIALRAISRDALDAVYRKVRQRTGTTLINSTHD